MHPNLKQFQQEHSSFHAPFGKALKVYKTLDHSSFDLEQMIKFYKDYYVKRNWKDDVFKRKGTEPYLALSKTIYEPEGKFTSIHVATKLYIWFAPKDGMVTLYMDMWKVSSLKNESRILCKNIENKLKEISKSIDYSFNEFSTTGLNWLMYHQNESLVSAKGFNISKKIKFMRGCGDETGIVRAYLLAYKNPDSAAEQAKNYKYTNPLAWGSSRIIVQNENVLLVLEYSDQQLVDLAASIAKKSKISDKK